MNILTLNYHYSSNYGAVLEAYALQQTLHRYTDNVVCLDYEFYEPIVKKILRRCRKALYCSDIRNRYIRKLWGFLDKRQRDYRKASNVYQRADDIVFDNFRARHLNVTNKKYSSIAALKNYAGNEIYAVICGSDVIWNVNNESLTIDAYFLAWVKPQTLKIAYAPSWGKPTVNGLNNSVKQHISMLLSKFDAVSVREKSGVDICASLGRTDAQWVPDPTMLLTVDDWDKIAESRFNKPYILNYRIPYNKSVDDTKILSVIEQCYKVPIKKVPDINSGYVWLSPTEWLGGIRDTEFVITNSFHGVVFCIMYNKAFLFTKLIGEYEMHNERIYSLLDFFELSDRIITEAAASNVEEIKSLVELPIDWNQVNKKLIRWRQVGIDFLDEALIKANKNKSANIQNSYVDR